MFKKFINDRKANTIFNINNLMKKGYRIIGYGAPAKASTLINFYKLSNKHISYIIDDNPLKQGYILPKANIPIYGSNKLLEEKQEIIIILCWNFYQEIKNKLKKLLNYEIQLIRLYPKYEIEKLN